MTDHRCGNPHPEGLSACEIKTLNHRTCTGWAVSRGEFVDWPNPEYRAPEPKLSRKAGKTKLAEMAANVRPAPEKAAETGFAAGLAGSERAAGVWDDEQKALVDAAIETVARRHARGGEFTSDAIWDELAGRVPVTKGLTSRLMVARRNALLDDTGKMAISERGGHHDHGQRLTVWYSLMAASHT